MKKLLLCLVALFAAIGAQAQDGDPTSGRTPQNIYVSPGTLPTDNIYFAPGWSASDQYSYTLTEDAATFVLTAATSDRWQAQFKIPTGVSFTAEDVYQLEFDYKATNAFTGHVKLYQNDDTYSVDQDLTMTAEVQHFKSSVYTNKPLENVILLFDWGTNPANTTIEVTNIKLIKYVTDEPIASPVAEISGITNNSAVLTLTSVPEGTTSVVVSGLGEGKDVNVDLTSKTANLEGLTANTAYNLTVTAHIGDKTSQSTVSFTTLSDSSSDKEVKMEFIEVNVSDLSALFKLKVQLIDNAESKESIHMYLRKANETPEATADDPYAIYGEDKGTPAVDMRDGIENPIYFNYTELEKNTKYVATAVVKKDGYTGIATTKFETLDKANGTTSYIENGYFKDGETTTSEDGAAQRLTYLATARYTFTYDKINETLYLTFNTRIRNNPDLPDLQAKYMLNVGDKTYYGAPLSRKGGFKDHFSFVINYRCPDIATHIANGDKMTFTYLTDYRAGGTSHFGGVQYDGTTSSVDFGEPADIQWINYTYEQQKPENENKNRYDLYKKAPKTQLMATVIDKDGHYLPRRVVTFEMATEEDASKAEVTYDLIDDQVKWFVTAKEQAADTHVDFEVVAYHELETEAASAPRRAVSADGKRLEAKRGFHYVESDTATGIDDIEADDANAPVRWFDLNGREISEPQKGMFVIRLQGSKATKMIAE